MTPTAKEALKNVRDNIRVLILENPTELPPSRVEEMANSYTIYINDVIEKYCNGQKEHGVDLVERDLDKELYQEMLDMPNYFLSRVHKWRLALTLEDQLNMSIDD